MSDLRETDQCLCTAVRDVFKEWMSAPGLSAIFTALFPLTFTEQGYSSAMLPDLCKDCPHIIVCHLIVLWMLDTESWCGSHW